MHFADRFALHPLPPPCVIVYSVGMYSHRDAILLMQKVCQTPVFLIHDLSGAVLGDLLIWCRVFKIQKVLEGSMAAVESIAEFMEIAAITAP